MNFARIIENYHDVLLFVLQLILIAPLTAMFVEIYNRKEKIAIRHASILVLNERLVSMITDIMNVFNLLSFLHYEDMMLELSNISSKGYSEGLETTNKSEYEEALKRALEHNAQIEIEERDRQKWLDNATFYLRHAEKVSQLVQSDLILYTSTYDVKEFSKISSISFYVGRIGSNASLFAFYLEQARRGARFILPDIFPAEDLLIEWKKYVSEMGLITDKSLRIKIMNIVAITLGYGDIFGTLPEDTKKRIETLITGMGALGLLKPEKQRSIIVAVSKTDFLAHGGTKIHLPE